MLLFVTPPMYRPVKLCSARQWPRLCVVCLLDRCMHRLLKIILVVLMLYTRVVPV